MHNEIVEALSTKGKIGLLVLIMFYVAMIYYCIRETKYILLVFPVSIMLFGISDVITHAKTNTGIVDCVPLPVYIVFE